MNDSLGDRIKRYEEAETGRRFMPLLPLYARIDGRSFSRLTKNMTRPYEPNMSRVMIETTKYLVEETNASVGYTQSDEISLAWRNDNPNSQMFFDGKVFKITSVLAAMATARFNQLAVVALPYHMKGQLPVFDCRAFQLPNLDEAANAILWRVQDATKNSISMAARAYFSHNELQNKSGAMKQEMLFQQGVNWNDYPQFFKEGTFVKRITEAVDLTPEELENIPENKRLKDGEKYYRHFIREMNWPRFGTIANKVDVLFWNVAPIIKDNG
jgi:tRNA(His) guanylyltransferase